MWVIAGEDKIVNTKEEHKFDKYSTSINTIIDDSTT